MNLRTVYFFARQFKQRNARRKTASSGRDLVIYCGETKFAWHPLMAGTHLGGSEEAVINLAPELVKLGWDVTVYNSCGLKPIFIDGVLYRPYWDFNPRDRQDVAILWRNPKLADAGINADRIFLDLHDTIPERRIQRYNRIGKLTGVMVKSKFHRSLYAGIPQEKLVVIPNGMDFRFLEGDVQKDPFLIINTSSPDRSMEVLPKLFKEIKQQVPQARLQWAYGWDVFSLFNAKRPNRLAWMEERKKEMAEAGIESVGWLSHAEVGKLYQRAAVLAYPTDFSEIDCISVKKAQACGCVPVATDAGALPDSVQFGIKVPCGRNDAPERTNIGFPFGLRDEQAQRMWVNAVVDLLQHPDKRMALAEGGKAWARQFSWANIAARWDAVLRGEPRTSDESAASVRGDCLRVGA